MKKLLINLLLMIVLSSNELEAINFNTLMNTTVSEKTTEINNIIDSKIKADTKFEIKSVQFDDEQNIIVIFSKKLSSMNDYRSIIELENLAIADIRVDDNKITIIPAKISYNKHILKIYQIIKSDDKKMLNTTYTKEIQFIKRKPSIKFTSKGVILPDSKQIEVPIEAVNVQSVHLRAFVVYENNIGQFFQNNKLEENTNIQKVGRLLWDKKIVLKNAKENDKAIYSLDISKLLSNENGSLIRLTAYIDRSDSLYECSDKDNAIPVKSIVFKTDLDSANYSESSGWDFSTSFSRVDNDNPCSDAYYHSNSQAKDIKNLLKSNIGIMAKYDSESDMIFVATSNLETANALEGVMINILNFQNQIIGTSITDKEGMAKINVIGVPFYLKAKKKKDIGYLKLSSGSAIPISQFDISGVHIKHNINGFIYGERDVWRPGDRIFLTFVLDDKKSALPKNYPIKMNLLDPSGQVIMSKINSTPSGSMYAFELGTDISSRTGKYKAIAYIGNQIFMKNLNIETVVPNHLKVELNINKKILKKEDKDLKGEVFAQWLHGAKAKSLKTDVTLRTKSIRTNLEKFNDYTFDDVTREYKGNKQEVFSGKLNQEGKVQFPIAISLNNDPSGMLKAIFTTKVYEESGEFSTSTQSYIYHPYSSYIGMKLPKGDSSRGMILTDQDHFVNLVMLDSSGNPLAEESIDLTFYKIKWKWWWDKTKESLARYASASSYNILSAGSTVTNKHGQAKWKIRIDYPDWGRYLVRACSKNSGHCSSKIIYIDWPGWAGRAVEQNTNDVAKLSLTSDKNKYEVGEIVTVTLPKSKNARILVSLESGTNILDQYWVDSNKSQLKIPITANMSPNFYVTVSLIQPHKDRENDMPLRLMGILNIMVNDKSTHLNPEIDLPDEIKPASTFEVKVSEKDGQAMNYSISVVDEGLLGLTNYHTPSLHNYFYKRKGLQVKTWDLYDDVVGAYSGSLERILDVGGSDIAKEEVKNKKNRFTPVVRYLGTFSVKENTFKTHKITLPNYIGAVRVMVVAAKDSKYGKVAKSVLVKSPISILATMPRVLNINEEISLPVDIFVMKNEINEVNVSVKAESDFFDIVQETAVLKFGGIGEQIAQLKLKTKDKLGKAKVTITAKGGVHSSSKTIFIDIGTPNFETYRSEYKRLKPNEEWSLDYTPHGISGTNKTNIEFSTIPPINLENRLDTLIKYPHGCIEQTTSSVFPQLYLSSITNLSDQEKKEVQKNINAAIRRLQSFQTGSGGFSYWPGENLVHMWGSNYVMHFLLEAKKKGYFIPDEMFTKLVIYQRKEARKLIGSSELEIKNQAYRLYLLALNKTENMAAMYRLKENPAISNISKWLLAAAYSTIGQKEIIYELIDSIKIVDVVNETNDMTFASTTREQALILMCATVIQDTQFSDNLALSISKDLSSSKWLNTQAIAFSLLSMSKYSLNNKTASILFTLNNKAKNIVKIDKSISVIKLDRTKKSHFYFKNTSDASVSVLIGNRGVPRALEEKNVSNGLEILVTYTDKDGQLIDVRNLQQGTNFFAKILVKNITNSNLKNIVLNYKVATGWQIHNDRLEGATNSNIDYQDIRDDRVYTYFEIQKGESKEFEFSLNASFNGEFYLPAVKVKSMYNNQISAIKKGMKVATQK